MIAPPMLAFFVSPALFYGGAAAVAAPILIHLLARRRFRRIRWAAMDFLIDAEKRNRRRIRMEEWILLALRCLAMLLIAAMIARPFMRPAGAGALLAGAGRAERVFVLDDSLSMSYVSSDGVVFDRARTAVQRILESVRRESPDDTVTIVRMTAPNAPIDSGTWLDDTQTAELLARLDALAPSQRSIEMPAVIDGVVDVLERTPDIPHAVIYFVSDFQRAHWGPPESRSPADRQAGMPTRPPASPASMPDAVPAGRQEGPNAADGSFDSDSGLSVPALMQPLSEWARQGRGLELFLVNVGESDAANVAITEVQLESGRLVAGTTGTVRAHVGNYSDRTMENLELQLAVGNLIQPSQTVQRLGPRQQAVVDLDADFVRAGSDAVRVELPPDALPADNVRHLVLDVAGAIRVLIVNGEPSSDGYDDEVTFLTTALRPEGEVFSGNEVTVIDESQFDDMNLSGYHLAILANVYRLSDPSLEALETFVRRGGGLIVFLGDQVHAELYNASMFRGGEGPLPARLHEVRRATDAVQLVITDRLHPSLRGLSREGDPLGIGQIPFFSFYAVSPVAPESPEESPDRFAPGAEPIGSDDLLWGGRETPRGQNARVVARFDDPDRSPAIVERTFGRGRVTLVTTSADKEWNLWPDHPTYLPVMIELARHNARRSDAAPDYRVGQRIEVPLEPGMFEPDALLRTPGFPNEREVGVTAAPASDGSSLALSWEHTDSAGLYQFVLRRREGSETVHLVAVNVDPRESDLTMAEEEDIRRAVGDVPFTYVRGIEGLDTAVAEARVELWRFVLIAVVLTLLTEQSLAWRWGRKR